MASTKEKNLKSLVISTRLRFKEAKLIKKLMVETGGDLSKVARGLIRLGLITYNSGTDPIDLAKLNKF